MPVIVTHHLFGEDAATLLPEGVLTGSEDLLAFLLGNQGPDPFWARVRTLPHRAIACHQFATSMHASHVVDAFLVMRESVSHLREDDKTVGRAFALGVAAHYLLDSVTHPLIYAQEQQLCQVDPSLAYARGEVHALMEAEIDSWTLWQKRQKTVLESPCSESLACTPRIERVAGALFSQVAWQVFDIEVGAAEYAGAVADYQLLYHLIDPPAYATQKALARVERLVRTHSRLTALAHPIVDSDSCPSANLTHDLWRNTSTGETSRASFPDLFHDALIAWPSFSRRLAEGDRERIAAMVDGINYNGIQVG